MLVRHHLVPPMVVVAPDTDGGGLRDTECLDDPRGGPQVETYLRTVVVPYVEAELRARGWPVLRRDEADQGHSWNTARIALPYGLVFAAGFLPPS